MPAGTLIVSEGPPAGQASTAASPFAAMTASRSAQSPSVLSSSTFVLTLIVAAEAGLAATSRVKVASRAVRASLPEKTSDHRTDII